MLRILTGDGARDCSGVPRRDFLRVGALGLGSLTLPSWLAARAVAASSGGESFVLDRSVVLLYLSGGASHIETFHPNMDAPAPYRSLTGEVSTSVPGLTFGGNFERLGRHAHRMTIVRSFHHPIGGHEQAHVHVLSGGTDPRGDHQRGFSIGSAATRVGGPNDSRTGMPNYVLLTHPEVDGQYRKELDRVRKGSWPGEMGPTFAPFEHDGGTSDPADTGKGGGNGKRRARRGRRSSGGGLTADLDLHVPESRLHDRRWLLEGLDRLSRKVESSGAVRASNQYQQLAFDLILGKGREAFDVSKEDPRLLGRYDTSGIRIGHKTFRPSSLGRQMLVARRLVESGCGFVTVHSAGWDMHADGNNPGIVKGMNMLGTTLDQAVSVFLDDLADRGLSDRVLLVITGDFGRTAKINQRGGRDHWANLGTLAFAGGGLPGGAIIGRSDRQNSRPDSPPVTPHQMMGTILHTLFDLGAMRIARGVPREVLAMLEAATPIPGLGQI